MGNSTTKLERGQSVVLGMRLVWREYISPVENGGTDVSLTGTNYSAALRQTLSEKLEAGEDGGPDAGVFIEQLGKASGEQPSG